MSAMLYSVEERFLKCEIIVNPDGDSEVKEDANYHLLNL
jgi:hypothetical protein